jgi:hypothetical protein
MMPLDCCLNKDVDDCVKWHVLWTNKLSNDDGPVDPDTGLPLKFDRSTTKRQSHAYLRLCNPLNPPDGGALSSKRIIQDVDRCAGEHLLRILAASGAIVPGLGSHNGHRKVTALAAGGSAGGHGGERVQVAVRKEPKWCHGNALQARADKRAIAAANAAAARADAAA